MSALEPWELREAVTVASCCPAHERSGARFLKESQKGSGYTSTSGQLEAIADNSRSTALHFSGSHCHLFEQRLFYQICSSALPSSGHKVVRCVLHCSKAHREARRGVPCGLPFAELLLLAHAIKLVSCDSMVAVLFLTLCFLDRTLANLQGVLLDGRHPFQFFPILQELERIIYIGRSPLSPMPVISKVTSLPTNLQLRQSVAVFDT